MTSYEIAEAFAPRFPQATAYLWRSQMALLRLYRQGLARREVEGGRRKGARGWIYRYRITRQGVKRLAYWRGQ